MSRRRKQKTLLNFLKEAVTNGFWYGLIAGLFLMTCYYGSDLYSTLTSWNWSGQMIQNTLFIPFLLILIIPQIIFWGLLIGVPAGILIGTGLGYYQYLDALKNPRKKRSPSLKSASASQGHTRTTGINSAVNVFRDQLLTLRPLLLKAAVLVGKSALKIWNMALDRPAPPSQPSKPRRKPRKASPKKLDLLVKEPKLVEVLDVDEVKTKTVRKRRKKQPLEQSSQQPSEQSESETDHPKEKHSEDLQTDAPESSQEQQNSKSK